MHEVVFFLPDHDFVLVKNLTAIEEFTLHHPQFVWTWGTYHRLKKKGYNVKLSNEMPLKGIVVVNSLNLPLFQKPSDDILLISILADSPPAFYPQINVSQNPLQFRDYPKLLRFPIWRHIAHWPQPGIIIRDKDRGDRFENIAFFGHRDQMEPYLQSVEFLSELNKMNVNFTVVDKKFDDYSSVDAVLAIREFGDQPYLNKPYSKLINAWAAGVPVVAGMESSFQSIKKSGLDFIAVKNKIELTNALKSLQQNSELRHQMVLNGTERSKEFTEEKIIETWGALLFNEAQFYYDKWINKNKVSKAMFYSDQLISRAFRSAKNRLIH
ncbi:MAG TPA: hypothetical protein VM884_00840 [Flavisolibacter sp.]|nr:hypothetical protein [Flavisolibacter sp.]